MDDAISIEVQWDKEGRPYLGLSRSLASMHSKTMGERVDGEEPLLSHKMVTGWATQLEVLWYDIDTNGMNITVPARKVDKVGRESGRVATGTGNGPGK